MRLLRHSDYSGPEFADQVVMDEIRYHEHVIYPRGHTMNKVFYIHVFKDQKTSGNQEQTSTLPSTISAALISSNASS